MACMCVLHEGVHKGRAAADKCQTGRLQYVRLYWSALNRLEDCMASALDKQGLTTIVLQLLCCHQLQAAGGISTAIAEAYICFDMLQMTAKLHAPLHLYSATTAAACLTHILTLD